MNALPENTLPQLGRGESLNADQMSRAMEAIVGGAVPDAQIEEFLLRLRQKKETVEEITAAAGVMRRHSVRLSKDYPGLLDTCGTGGDNQRTLNVSTLAAIVSCAAGAKIGKHGNRSVSSLCGSADLLEMLGIRIDLPVPAVEQGIEELGFGFFFAPKFHPATRFAMPARKKIQGKTIFNILGPLSNPAGALYQLVGVYEPSLVETMATALLRLGTKRAMVVHAEDGLDEISLCGKTHAACLENGAIKIISIQPEDFGLKKCRLEELRCSSKEESLKAAQSVLGGVQGPKTDVVCLNAGAALWVAGSVRSIQEGVRAASDAVRGGQAKKKLDAIAAFSQRSGQASAHGAQK